jgi:hypothetical protein
LTAPAGIEPGAEGNGSRPPAPADEFVGSVYQLDSHAPQAGIFVTAWAMQITQTRAELLVLSQFVYWFGVSKRGKLRARIQEGGYYWVAKTFSRLARETYLSRDQVRGAVRSLVAAGILINAGDGHEGRGVRYRLNVTAIEEAAATASLAPSAGEEDEDDR